MTETLNKLFAAADNHGEGSGEPDHTIGVLRDLLRRSWEIMSVSQRLQLLESTEVEDLTEAGARCEFEPADLVAEITKDLAEMEAVVAGAGYTFIENDAGIYWELDDEASEDFYAREDAVTDAHAHFVSNQSGLSRAEG